MLKSKKHRLYCYENSKGTMLDLEGAIKEVRSFKATLFVFLNRAWEMHKQISFTFLSSTYVYKKVATKLQNFLIWVKHFANK